jgi:hypothetical protein
METPLARLVALLLLLINIQCTSAFHSRSITKTSAAPPALFIRGGSDSEYDESEYDTDDEEEEPIIKKSKALASSTKSKLATAKKAAAKSAAAKAMASSKPVKTTSSGGSVTKLYRRMVPHIIRCVLNPFTFVRMSRAYFASLLDINYMKEEPAQNLRSALEQKARQQPSSPNSGPPKRKMKPGQAKTLSDLPQLSA